QRRAYVGGNPLMHAVSLGAHDTRCRTASNLWWYPSTPGPAGVQRTTGRQASLRRLGYRTATVLSSHLAVLAFRRPCAPRGICRLGGRPGPLLGVHGRVAGDQVLFVGRVCV